MKISPMRPSLIFAGAQIDLVAADHGFLGVAFAAIRQLFALAAALDPLHDPLDDALGDLGRARRLVLRDESLDRVVLVLVVIGDELRVERLRQFGAVAIERVGLEREAPGQQIGRLAFLDAGLVRHVDGFRDRARDEGLRRRHHADVALDREVALAGAPARIGAVEHREMLGLQVRGAFQRHRAADMDVGGVDVGLGVAEEGQQLEATDRRASPPEP